MSQVAKLKKQAAEFEAKRQFDKAVGVYIKLLEAFDAFADELDIGLFNRVGDLLLRQGNVADAVDYYERGIDKYSDTGFFNNAIALCNKVLRHSPGRASIYYKLGRISAKKGFTNEARTNFLEYADRMQKSGNTDEAFRALTEFADLCPDQDEIRLTLAEQFIKAGRKDDAMEQLQTLHERLDGEGRTNDAHSVAERMRTIDPGVLPRKSSSGGKSKSSELIFIDVDEPTFSPSMPSGIPLVPSPTPIGLVEFPPVVASPAIGTQAVTPPGSITLSSAIDPDIYTVEEASTIFGGTVDGFVHTQLDDASQGPLDGRGARQIHVPGTPPPEDAVEAVPEAIEAMAEEPPAETEDEPRAEEGDGAQAEIADGAPEDADPESALRAAIEDDAPTQTPWTPSTPADATELVDETEPEPLDEPMDELLANVAQSPPASDHRTPASPAFPSPVLSPTLSVPVEPPCVDELSPWDADMPVAGAATESFASEDEDEDAGQTADSMDLAFGQSPATDSPIVGASALLEESSPTEETPTPAREAPAEPAPRASAIPGILLADALEASSRPENGADGSSAPLDEGIDEPIAFATPSQARRSTAVAARSVEALMASVQAAPDDWVLHRDLGEAMLDAGDRDGGIRELESAMAGAERDGKLDLASSIAEEVARIEPEMVKHQQKRVEYAFRTNDRARLIEAYLGLANVLLRSEQVEKARTIYQRVLDLAPDEPRARLALGSITPSAGRTATSGFTPIASRSVRQSGAIPMPRRSGGAPVRPPSGSYINLGDALRGDDIPRDTRMVVPEEEPTGDEQADFADMLRKFKAGIARNVAPEDHQSHYDLAIAYKEMGLVDEAIAEFQLAAKDDARLLECASMLGICFVEKGMPKLAVKWFEKGLAAPGRTEEEYQGLRYDLANALEQAGDVERALALFTDLYGQDANFRDVAAKVRELRSPH